MAIGKSASLLGKIKSLEIMTKDAEKRLKIMQTNNISLNINLANVIHGDAKLCDLRGLSEVAKEYKKDLEKQEKTLKSMENIINDIKILAKEVDE